jgi:hypothetical protein
MPKLSPRPPLPVHWPLRFSRAAGGSLREYFVLAYSNEYNEAYAQSNPDTYVSPTSQFTHVLRFDGPNRTANFVLPDRLLDLWWSPTRRVAYAVGFPRGVFELDASGMKEFVLDDPAGTFTSVWGVNDNHLFVCGFKPFVQYRKFDKWFNLPLPDRTVEHLHAVNGSSETDVYVVGSHGTILHFDGRTVSTLESPTTRHLLSIEPLGNKFCIGGAQGIFLFGDKNGWRIVPIGVSAQINSMASYRDQILFGSEQGVFAFNGIEAPRIVYSQPAKEISGLGDVVLIASDTNAALFDGKLAVPLNTTL